MSAAKRGEGASNYHTSVGSILSRIWHLQNVPFKVAACLHLSQAGGIVTARAGGLLRIHSSRGSNLKAR